MLVNMNITSIILLIIHSRKCLHLVHNITPTLKIDLVLKVEVIYLTQVKTIWSCNGVTCLIGSPKQRLSIET